MYGSAGAPGTTGSQGGGSAQGGQAVAETSMDISNMAMMSKQLELLDAQKEKTYEEGRLAGEKADAVGGYEKVESGARTTKLGKEVEEIGAKIENLSEEKKRIVATTEKEVSEKERIDIETEIKKYDRDFFKDNKLAPSDFGIIKGLYKVGFDMWGIAKWILNVSPEEIDQVLDIPNKWWNKNN
jgi:hypothetical protein